LITSNDKIGGSGCLLNFNKETGKIMVIKKDNMNNIIGPNELKIINI
jgi:hypothetical protein